MVTSSRCHMNNGSPCFVAGQPLILYRSKAEAARQTPACASHITTVCRGAGHTSGGLGWRDAHHQEELLWALNATLYMYINGMLPNTVLHANDRVSLRKGQPLPAAS